MTQEPRHFDVIRRPLVTEKTTGVSASGAVVFEAAMDADKETIKESVEALFKVKVRSVNTLVVKGKRKRFRGRIGRRSGFKKAYVRLEEGYVIDVDTSL